MDGCPDERARPERTSRTIKDATTEQHDYESHEDLRPHLELFLKAYDPARRLKTLKGLKPAQFAWKEWQARPHLFHEEPCHVIAGLNGWPTDTPGSRV